MELRTFRDLEKLTYDLERRPDYSVLSCYRAIDRRNEGRIDKINLDGFFRNLGVYLSDRELLALIRRIDTEANQMITL
jgi:Ca2+-binding EF-hand superfamily protein